MPVLEDERSPLPEPLFLLLNICKETEGVILNLLFSAMQENKLTSVLLLKKKSCLGVCAFSVSVLQVVCDEET